MSHQNIAELLKRYRPLRARYSYLQSQLEMLGRFLAICKGEMIEDQVSMSQAITGMPHGSSIGDPTGRLAMDIASGKVTEFVKQIQEEIEKVQSELRKVTQDIQTVDLILETMNERERNVLEMKMIDELSWTEIVEQMQRKYSKCYSKRSIQRLLDRAVDKAYEIVK